MIDRPIEPVHRAISIITFLQLAVVAGGTMFVKAMVRAAKAADWPDEFFRSDALFIRRFGFALLLLPVAWMLTTLFVSRKVTRPWPAVVLLLLGVGAIVCGIRWYVLIGSDPSAI